jgi:hypothetical protein
VWLEEYVQAGASAPDHQNNQQDRGLTLVGQCDGEQECHTEWPLRLFITSSAKEPRFMRELWEDWDAAHYPKVRKNPLRVRVAIFTMHLRKGWQDPKKGSPQQFVEVHAN